MENSKYLSDWETVFIFIIGTMVFVLIGLLVAKIIRPNKPNYDKLTTYESGEEPVGNAWNRINIRYYTLALIFILFEVELIFLFPWATVYANKSLIQQSNGLWLWFSLSEMAIFILILAIGLAYAWAKGFLDWTKPTENPQTFVSPVPNQKYQELNAKFGK